MKYLLIISLLVVNSTFGKYNQTITLWFGGLSFGTEKLKIGELAERTGVTKRTIDYYTNFGLLKAERSPSNYRYYDISAVEQLNDIEKCKEQGMSLEDIKKRMIDKNAEEIDVLELRLKIKGLEKDVAEVLSQLEKSNLKNHEFVKKNVSQESLSLIQSLLLLLN
ncbi:MerR family transcriptional regulator [Metabacillus endolithicus]|nr:MerR family transcriptional regulator [Metabacillus endolithicus]UPG62482.1 MerR family transcriptional regulator [Metabacillus endolithicus]